MATETQTLGTGTNPADALPRLGRKTLASEAAVSYSIHTNHFYLVIFWQLLMLWFSFNRSCNKLNKKCKRPNTTNTSRLSKGDGKHLLEPLTAQKITNKIQWDERS